MAASHWQTKAARETLLQRARMLKNIRAFFDERGVIEVETPLLSHFASTDPHLDSLQSCFREQHCYLNTSPEYAMKRLLADWQQSIYQICKAFRDDELGPYHNPEFSLLEWYRIGFDMPQLMDELEQLIKHLCQLSPHISIDDAGFERLSYQQAFETFAGINPHQANARQCYQLALEKGIEIPQGLGPDDDLGQWLDWLLMQLVLPGFAKERFTFMYDYPASQCALAKTAVNEQGITVAKRFELFFGEVELANGFHELTDADEQLSRFQQENRARQQAAKAQNPIDENFIAALKSGLPECSGVALGLDRLLMVFTRSRAIEQVLSFSWENS